MQNEYLEFAKQIAYDSGKIMLKYFNNKDIISYKLDQTIVTIADKEINEYLIKMVKEKYPSHSVDGEESQFGKSNLVWVCDPIDGTAMYSRQIPVAVFSLALVNNGEPIIGVVYDPFMNNLYYGVKDKGAYKNNEKISVNNITLDDKRSISHFDMIKYFDYNTYDLTKKLSEKTYFVSVGSIIRACMCIAEGNFTLAIYPGTTHKNCDIAAVKVIVEEAGGIVTDLFGNEQRYDCDINGAVISNRVVHTEVISEIKNYLKNHILN